MSIKVIKRNGLSVDYNPDKIRTAISKANNGVIEEERVSDTQINNIIKYIEGLNKKRILVEDIQDIIEIKLMTIGKYQLAKEYITYRYTRALIRKSNTTDELILTILRDGNDEYDSNNLSITQQKDLISGIVSRDISKRILLPEKISKAISEKLIIFHNIDHFIQPIFNSSIINLEDMLQNGFILNDLVVKPPTNFKISCIITGNIINEALKNQNGNVSLNIKYLARYIKSDSDLNEGLEILKYQIYSQKDRINILLELDEEKNTSLIIKKIFEDDNNNLGKFIYVLNDSNCLNNGKYDYLTKLAISYSLKNEISFMSSKKMIEEYGMVYPLLFENQFISPYKKDNRPFYEGRFNQGIISLDLEQLALLSNKNYDEFWKIFDEKIDLTIEALMCKHYALFSANPNTSPIHYRCGAIARYSNEEKIDKLLKNGYSTLTFGYFNLNKMINIMTDNYINEEIGKHFGLKVLQTIKTKIDKFNKETGLSIMLYNQEECNIDNTEIYEKLDLTSDLLKISNGGFNVNIEFKKYLNNPLELQKIIKYIYNNVKVVSIKNNK